jgi:hypothetical protein
MEALLYLIPAGVVGAVGLAYSQGVFSTTPESTDTSFVDRAFSPEGGRRRKKHRKTKRRGTK